MSEKSKNLVTRTVTGVLFVAIMVMCILSPGSMVMLFAIITGMTVWEFASLVNNMEGVEVNRLIATAAGVYLFLAFAGAWMGITDMRVFLPYLVTVVYMFVSELYNKSENPVNSWAYTMLSQMYVALPLSMMNVLSFQQTDEGTLYNYLVPLSVFIFLWANDTGAYCSGSLFGRHKLFPRISPGKTWEGSIGGAVLVLAVAALVGYLDNNSGTAIVGSSYYITIPQWMGLGLVVVFFGTWGDLVESLFKRTLGVKDSGKVLPGHGGMLDRFDSSLMALPASVVYLDLVTWF